MSALTLPPPPRLRLVSVDSADTAGRAVHQDEEHGGAGPRLRLVTEDFVPDAPGCRGSAGAVGGAVESVKRPMRRPAMPRSVRAAGDLRAEGERRRHSAEGMRPEDLAPCHPAVRAQRRRDLEARWRRTAQNSGTSVAAGGKAVPAASGRIQAFRRVPAGIRCLGILSGMTLGLALLLAVSIVATALVGGSPRTTTTTVQAGQSLWEVAAAMGTGDVNETMAQIVELNGLKSSTVEPGQVLVVPAG